MVVLLLVLPALLGPALGTVSAGRHLIAAAPYVVAAFLVAGLVVGVRRLDVA
ncbi:hypothetical protein [Mobilicoccus pelagius]|uniref:Uncharacterized protein n=1 Tax=Mobilicoccus pelagius NBRC 104925 TaxID=1089455 RepID=H5UTQ8_9MICO|nr:hypothetical protein [Mobilicoccus pelagius]GAB49116.1 hypothetical protein MOPEL_096_01240 [Mobilicoccus pelagius NBRC 104925]